MLTPLFTLLISHSKSYLLHPSFSSCASCPSFLGSFSLSFLAFFLYCFPLPYRPGSLVPRGADPQPVCMSVCAPVPGQISLSSELQPGSLPPDADADESSSDMLVIVDDPVSSAPQSRATNSPSSVSGSVSDNMNGERVNMFLPTFDLDVWASGAIDCKAASTLFQDHNRMMGKWAIGMSTSHEICWSRRPDFTSASGVCQTGN